jgi:hypothetical protein
LWWGGGGGALLGGGAGALTGGGAGGRRPASLRCGRMGATGGAGVFGGGAWAAAREPSPAAARVEDALRPSMREDGGDGRR